MAVPGSKRRPSIASRGRGFCSPAATRRTPSAPHRGPASSPAATPGSWRRPPTTFPTFRPSSRPMPRHWPSTVTMSGSPARAGRRATRARSAASRANWPGGLIRPTAQNRPPAASPIAITRRISRPFSKPGRSGSRSASGTAGSSRTAVMSMARARPRAARASRKSARSSPSGPTTRRSATTCSTTPMKSNTSISTWAECSLCWKRPASWTTR